MDGKQPGDPGQGGGSHHRRRRIRHAAAAARARQIRERQGAQKTYDNRNRTHCPSAFRPIMPTHHETIHSPYHRRDRLYRRAVGAAAAGRWLSRAMPGARRDSLAGPGVARRASRRSKAMCCGRNRSPTPCATSLSPITSCIASARGQIFPNAMCRPRATLLPLRKAKESTDHLPRRPRRPRHGSLRASALAPSDRRRVAGKRRASHRVSRGSDRRIGQSVL